MGAQQTARWVVLKFGGTSVSTRERWDTIAFAARSRLDEGLRPVVVCSALSGVSNALEKLLAEAPLGRHQDVLRTIRDKHEALAAQLGVDPQAILAELFEDLERFALGASLVREVSPRLHARVLARGELMATRLGAEFLRTRSLPTTWIDARACLVSSIEPNATERRSFLSANCHHAPDPALQDQFAATPGDVILTQGFIARNPAGDTVLLGRGGSDTSASIFAARLQAERCEIWTDVPGMFTANPRQIPAARLLRALDYDEAQEIVSTGAKVLHPRSIAPARAAGIPIHVLCTDRPDLEGTVVSRAGAGSGAQVKAVSVKTGVVLVVMETPGMWQQVGFLADVFACFKRAGLSIDLVSTSEMNVTVSLDTSSNPVEASVLDRLVDDLAHHCRASIVGPCASVSLVGRNIRAILHKLGPALELFEEQRVHLVSQAANDLNLSFVVDTDQAERLLRQLHALLFSQRKHDPVLGPTWHEVFEGESVAEPRALPWWTKRREQLLALARDRTPLYVLDPSTLDESISDLREIDAVGQLLYAVKANPHEGVLRRFHNAGLGFECVSPGELEHVLRVLPGIPPDKILFTPNFAPREEYALAFERGVRVTLDNLYPLQAWPDVFRGRALLVRVDPGQGRGHHEYVQTAGTTSKFGVSTDQLDELMSLLGRLQVRVVGLHAHLGSGIRTAGDWADTAVKLAQIAERFPDVRVLDLGGGLGVPERFEQSGLDLRELRTSLRAVRNAHPRYELWLEPGRFLVAQAGVLLARVTQMKTKGDVLYVGVDAGMNTLLRPALYGAYHEIVNLSQPDRAPQVVANVVGPICESGDTLGHNRQLAAPRDGDVLLIATVGAYGRAMSSWYNLRAPADEVLLPD